MTSAISQPWPPPWSRPSSTPASTASCGGVVLAGRPQPARRDQFVVFLQNHDQVGNRPGGARLGHHIAFAQRKLGAATVLLSPFVPLLFMGEEYGEPNPFLYITHHGDPDLIAGVRAGRRAEFSPLELGHG